MPRVKRGVTKRARHKKILKLAKGYFGSKSKLFRPAAEQVLKSLAYAYAHRRKKKGDFRKLWITRINAACRVNGLSYSKFINGLKIAGININRKVLSEMATNDAATFAKLTEVAKQNMK